MFVQRFLGSLRGKPCSSLETLQLAGKNVWRKVVLTSEKKFWRDIITFSPQFCHRGIKKILIRGKCEFLLELPRNML